MPESQPFRSRPEPPCRWRHGIRPLDADSEPAWDAFVAAHAGRHLLPSRRLGASHRDGFRPSHALRARRARRRDHRRAAAGACEDACCSATRWCRRRSASMAARSPPISETAARWRSMPTTLRKRAGASAVEFARPRVPSDSDWLVAAGPVRHIPEADRGRPRKNLKAIPRKQRAMVRKGIQNGLISVVRSRRGACCTASTPRACAISARRCSPAAISRILAEAFGDCCDIVTVLDAGQPIASVLNFYFRDEVLPYYGGGTRRRAQRAGNDFMYWEVMRRAADRGCRLFDFGRSKLGTGAFDFKHNWGFEPDACTTATSSRRAPRSRTSTRSTRNTGCSSRPGNACRCRSPICSGRRSCAGSAEPRCAICCSSRIACPIRPTRARRSAPGISSAISRAAHRMHLGCLIDDPDDRQHIADAARALRRACCLPLDRAACSAARRCCGCAADSRCRSAISTIRGCSAGSMPKLARGRIDIVFVFSSAMAPYVMHAHRRARRILDMVDVDSENGPPTPRPRASRHAQIWAREGRTLLAFERRAAARFDHSLFVSEHEWQRLSHLRRRPSQPPAGCRMAWISNIFRPAHASRRRSPASARICVHRADGLSA